MKKLIISIGKLFFLLERVWNYCIRSYRLSLFKSVGNNIYIGSGGRFTEKNISIGNNVSIGKNCCFQSSHGEIIIGSQVMFGPGVHIHGGNHSIENKGYYMKEINNKKPGDDGLIVIEDDCWIGSCVIILKGVTIGRGSVVGAGSVVTKDIPPYSIYTGAPALKLKKRWSEVDISEHERILKERIQKRETV